MSITFFLYSELDVQQPQKQYFQRTTVNGVQKPHRDTFMLGPYPWTSDTVGHCTQLSSRVKRENFAIKKLTTHDIRSHILNVFFHSRPWAQRVHGDEAL